jgi:hypothetical protein
MMIGIGSLALGLLATEQLAGAIDERKVTIEGLFDALAAGLGEPHGGRSRTSGVARHLCFAVLGRLRS